MEAAKPQGPKPVVVASNYGTANVVFLSFYIFRIRIGVSRLGIGRPATRAKALNLYTGTFSRV